MSYIKSQLGLPSYHRLYPTNEELTNDIKPEKTQKVLLIDGNDSSSSAPDMSPIKIAEIVLPIFSHSLKVAFSRGNLINNDEFKKAKKYFETNGNSNQSLLMAAHLAPRENRWEYYCFGAYQNIIQNQPALALEFLKEIPPRFKNEQFYFLKALALKLNKQFISSHKLYKKLIAILPRNHKYTPLCLQAIHEIKSKCIHQISTKEELEYFVQDSSAEILFSEGLNLESKEAIYNMAICWFYGIGCRKSIGGAHSCYFRLKAAHEKEAAQLNDLLGFENTDESVDEVVGDTKSSITCAIKPDEQLIELSENESAYSQKSDENKVGSLENSKEFQEDEVSGEFGEGNQKRDLLAAQQYIILGSENADVNFQIAKNCEFGIGRKVDMEMALLHYVYAARQGNCIAQYKCALMPNGISSRFNFTDRDLEAFLNSSAAQMYPPALQELTERYKTKQNSPKDRELFKIYSRYLKIALNGYTNYLNMNPSVDSEEGWLKERKTQISQYMRELKKELDELNTRFKKPKLILKKYKKSTQVQQAETRQERKEEWQTTYNWTHMSQVTWGYLNDIKKIVLDGIRSLFTSETPPQ